MATPAFIRLPEVIKRTGLARSTIYQRIREGTFPRHYKLGVKASGWREDEIDGWLESLQKSSEASKAAA